MDKSSDAFRTISEVAADLDLPQHVLRFWETRFAQIKPLKRGGGRRYYRPDDVDLLRGIRYLLYGEGYTIKGVQRILKDQGVRFVMALWQDGATGLDESQRAKVLSDVDSFDADLEPDINGTEDIVDDEFTSAGAVEGTIGHAAIPRNSASTPSRSTPIADPRSSAHASGAASPERAREAAFSAARTVSQVPPPAAHRQQNPAVDEVVSPEAIAQRFAPRSPEAPTALPTTRGLSEKKDAIASEWSGSQRQQTFAPMIERLRGGGNRSQADTLPTAGSGNEDPIAVRGLSRDDVRRLQATLFELLECKRLLDQTR